MQIGEDEVQVWFARLERSAEGLARARAILSADEIARADGYRFDKDRNQFVVARAVLREMIAEYVGRPARSLEFEYNAWGKPSLKAGTAGAGVDLRFNLAHTRGLAMCGFARGRMIGVDIEAIDEEVAAGRVAEEFFTAGEVAALRGLAREYQAEGFFNCWTRKEACVKARGEGLGRGTKSFEVSLRPGEEAAIVGGVEWRGWSLRSYAPAGGYAAASAVEGVGIRVVGPRFW